MSKKILFLFFLFSFGLKLNAQDLHYSQFLYSPLNLGASEAGNMDADLRIAGLHRRQWASVTVPYQTFTIGADCRLSALNPNLNGWGAGVLINQDKAGDGELQTLNFDIALSYSFALTNDSVHFIHLGLTGGFTQKNIDVNKLTFDEQFNGDNFIPLAPSGEVFDHSKIIYPDFGFSGGWSATGKKNYWNAGIQFLHLSQPDQSFIGSEKIKLPVLTQLHISDAYGLNEQLTLMPALNLMLQRKFTELDLGMEARLQIHTESVKKYAVGLGLFVRNRDAVIPMISLYLNKFRFGFSYDINTSSLRNASNGYGGPEISVVYMSKRIRTNNFTRTVCPVY